MDLPEKQMEFLRRDYDLKVKYLSDQFTRMWTRFHFFLVLESGLSAALWVWFKDRGVFAREGLMIAGIGAVSSCIWYIFGAQDRYLVEVYRRQVRDAGRDIANKLGIPIPPDPDGEPGESDYVYVGYSNAKIPYKNFYQRIYQWRCDPISTTKLAALFPILVVLYWGVMLVIIWMR